LQQAAKGENGVEGGGEGKTKEVEKKWKRKVERKWYDEQFVDKAEAVKCGSRG
jgi:hypothetical protein